MRYYVENFGCRATQADGAALEEQLGARGLLGASSVETADLVVVNTCTVTAAADQQARQYIRRVHRKNGAAHMLVTGCYAQRAPEELAALPGVTWVVGNSHKPQIPSLVERARGSAPDFVPLARLTPSAPGELSLALGPAKILTGNIFEQREVLVAPVFGSGRARAGGGARTRPTLKIQEGCNNRCAYCVIPFVRGRSRSLPPDEVIAQAQRLEAAGYQELVLSGVDLGSYGLEQRPRTGLRELTERLLDETSIPLLRFSSLEPMDLTDEFLALLASTDRIARHVHAPLQSGSNRILRRMRRWYTREAYAERILAAAAALPNLGLGADVMVGFPGETESDFRDTYELIERLPFTYLHVFGFSSRPGTAAAAMKDEVPAPMMKERSRLLRALAARKAAAFRARQIGNRLRVLTLAATGAEGARRALSENYLQVTLSGACPPNALMRVQVTEVVGETL
ncbi:MAG: tRNA (N(6)-L-threonylcarbamoyladenosine(37)-C(2))-methylthiotransferase MtaB, partial [Terriglobia bacterium]